MRPPQAQPHIGLISTMAVTNPKSLLHPSVNQPAFNQSKKSVDDSVKVNGGYKAAVAEISSRFDVNNKELNKRKFNDQYGHIINASRAKGAKFTKNEVSLSLTPPFADQVQSSGHSGKKPEPKSDIQLLMASDSELTSKQKLNFEQSSPLV